MDKKRKSETLKKVRTLLKALSGKKKIIIVSHDNPDPDTLASAYALRDLIIKELKVDVTIGFGGIVGRAENRAMVRYLSIPLKHLDTLKLSKFDATVLVDSQPHTGQTHLPDLVKPDVVVDHHPITPETRGITFHDVQSRIGATSTIITEYYMAKGMEPDSRLATALLYGIKSDTRDLGRETGKHDLEAYLYLYPRANLKLLSKIEHAEVPMEYFRIYDRAIDNAIVLGGAVISFIGSINNPDMVAEIADTLLRLEGASCTLVGGYFKGQIYISMRTKNSDLNAGELIRRIVGKLGPAGGHGSMAAGRIRLKSPSKKDKRAIEKNLINALRRTLNLKGVRRKKLNP